MKKLRNLEITYSGWIKNRFKSLNSAKNGSKSVQSNQSWFFGLVGKVSSELLTQEKDLGHIKSWTMSHGPSLGFLNHLIWTISYGAFGMTPRRI